MWLVALFILIPIIEIALFIQVGGWIGLWPTLALVIAMAFFGSWLLRRQGLLAMADVQRSFRDLRDPTAPMAHAALVMFAGLLMLTPGFFTDILGLALLIRPVRSWLIARISLRLSVSASGFGPDMRQSAPIRPASDDVIDGDYSEIEPQRDSIGPSGWTRH